MRLPVSLLNHRFRSSRPLVLCIASTMLLRCIVAALAGGMVLEAVAGPVSTSQGSVKKREVPRSHQLHERHTPQVAQRWAKRDKVASNIVLPMRIGLRQSNLDAGHAKLEQMYVFFVYFFLPDSPLNNIFKQTPAADTVSLSSALSPARSIMAST